jgi:hypothetical protein
MASPLDGLVNDYLDAQESLEKWKNRLDELKAEVIRSIGVGNTHSVVPGVGVGVRLPSRRWNVDQARRVLLPEQLLVTLETAPSLAMATANLPAPLVDLCRVPVGNPVVYKL